MMSVRVRSARTDAQSRTEQLLLDAASGVQGGKMEPEYQRALDEYEAICAYHRTEDQLKWQVLGIAYGAAALLAAAAVEGRYSYAALALAAGACMASMLGTAVYSRLSQYTLWRLERAWELEKTTLRFNHHRHLKARHLETGGKNTVNKVVKLGYWVPWIVWVGFLAITLAKR